MNRSLGHTHGIWMDLPIERKVMLFCCICESGRTSRSRKGIGVIVCAIAGMGTATGRGYIMTPSENMPLENRRVCSLNAYIGEDKRINHRCPGAKSRRYENAKQGRQKKSEGHSFLRDKT